MIDKKNDKGILIVAVGHPYYGRMAYNLTMTIKSCEKDFPVAVVCSERSLNHLSAEQKSIIDHVIFAPGISQNCTSKLFAYQYTPFKKTLLLDADTLFVPGRLPSELFHQLDGVSFTGITEGHDGDVSQQYFFWCDPGEVKRKFPAIKKIYQWRSELIYFEKCAAIKKLFWDALKIASDPGVTFKKYKNAVPDELAINIAAAINDIHPHVYKWRPSYWFQLNGGLTPNVPAISKQFWIISFGGDFSSPSVKRMYDNTTAAASYKLGLQHVFPLHSKQEFIVSERSKI